jgi:UDP:flavonoid glycosyltransferase YjiC (YdhE family)
MHYIGPLVWEPAGELPDALNRFDPDRRVLYFTLGSTGLPHLFKRVIEVLRSTDFYVIVSTGNHVTPADLGLLPDTFWTASFWPGSQVVRRCDVVICHGGNTTIYQALAAGVPVIAIPTHMDQRLNAELLVNTGCGMFLAPEAVGQIGQKVTEVLSRPSYYKENAVRMQKVLAGYDGPRTAVWLILGHIGCSLT